MNETEKEKEFNIFMKWLLGKSVLALAIAALLCCAAGALKNEKGPIGVIGGGLSGLSAALELHRLGFRNITIYEKQEKLGGRLRNVYSPDGKWQFNAGPSWYWMPDLMEAIFSRFSDQRAANSSFLANLTRLDPAYRVYWEGGRVVDVPGTEEGLYSWIEGKYGTLTRLGVESMFIEGQVKYEAAVTDWLWKPIGSLLDLIKCPFVWAAVSLDMFGSVESHVERYTGHPVGSLIHTLLAWPVIFLGASPRDAPAVYTLLAYAGHARGTYMYPEGDMLAVVSGLETLIGEKEGIYVCRNCTVLGVNADKQSLKAISLTVANVGTVAVDAVVASADYYFVEQQLLPKFARRYDHHFWARQALSPSCLLFFVGFNRTLEGLMHHTFFFDEPLEEHLYLVFEAHAHSRVPTFYVSSLLNSLESVGITVLVPLSPRVNGTDTDEMRDQTFKHIIGRLGRNLNISSLGSFVQFKECYGPREFSTDFNAFRGNAFGLGNVLSQSLMLKPAMQSVLSNVVFAGQMTQPGPGMPPVLLSGIMAANLLSNHEDGTDYYYQYQSFFVVLFTLILLLTWKGIAMGYSYCYCSYIMFVHAKTYWLAALLMDESGFFYIAALYSLFRVADDLVDNQWKDAKTRRKELCAFESAFYQCFTDRKQVTAHPVLPAVIDTVRAGNIDPQLFTRFFRSMHTDIHTVEFETMADLNSYMDGSAAVIGEVLVPFLIGPNEIPKYESKDIGRIKQHAADLGKAFQLTNIIRDVGEDLQLGRQYIPSSKWTKHGVLSPLHSDTNNTVQLGTVVEDMFDEASPLYESGMKGALYLPETSKKVVLLALLMYRDIHDEIRKQSYNVVNKKRIHVSWRKKLERAMTLLSLFDIARVVILHSTMTAIGLVIKHAVPLLVCMYVYVVASLLVPSFWEASYMFLHVAFTLPCITFLLFTAWIKSEWAYVRLVAQWTGILCVIANVYTIPWDNFMIWKGAWSYGPGRIIPFQVGYCPYEEYAFFTLQTLFVVGNWLWYFDSPSVFSMPHRRKLRFSKQNNSGNGLFIFVLSLLVAVLLLGVHLVHHSKSFFYMGSLLMWTTPVLILQWVCGGRALIAHAHHLVYVVLFSVIPLWIINKWGIVQGIWSVSTEYTTPLVFDRVMPVEEALFYVCTTLMCVHGITLATLLSCLDMGVVEGFWEIFEWGSEGKPLSWSIGGSFSRQWLMSNAIGMLALVSVYVSGTPSLESQIWLFVVGLVFVGIPHGALDGAVLMMTKTTNRLTVYLATIAFVFCLSLFFPKMTFVLFLVVSVYHFGEGDVQSTSSFDLVEIAVRGGFICVGMYNNPGESAFLLKHALGEPNIEPLHIILTNTLYHLHGFFLLLCISRRLFLSHANHFAAAIEMAVLYFVFATLPCMLSFSIYFFGYHGLRHFARVSKCQPKAMSLKLTAVYTFPVLVFGSLLYLCGTRYQHHYLDFIGNFWSVFISVISCLTIPHAGLVYFLLRRPNIAGHKKTE
eukprot:Nk52_evm7s161 gene=Nk52_evmTU7s161